MSSAPVSGRSNLGAHESDGHPNSPLATVLLCFMTHSGYHLYRQNPPFDKHRKTPIGGRHPCRLTVWKCAKNGILAMNRERTASSPHRGCSSRKARESEVSVGSGIQCTFQDIHSPSCKSCPKFTFSSRFRLRPPPPGVLAFI